MPPEANDLPVIPDDRGDDLQGLEVAENADLVVFMAGNQFMVMPDLVATFRARHPSIRNIFYETLPPKIDKQRTGETRLTTVHHRETPRRLMEGRVDVGPVWATEVEHALREGLPLEGVEVGEALDQRAVVRYFACPLRTGRNPDHARMFLAFLRSDEARRIYADFGFTPAPG